MSDTTIETPADLFGLRLRETYYVEEELVRALDEMARNAENRPISLGFAKHSEETKAQVERLRESFSALGSRPEGTTNPAFDGLMEQRRQMEEQLQPGDLLDVFYLEAGTQIERLEITSYESLLLLADRLELDDDVTDPLRQNLQEERTTLAQLQSLAAASELKTLWRNLLE